MRHKLYQFSFSLIAVLLIVIMPISAQDSELATLDPTGITITYWHEWDDAQLQGINLIISDFNENNEWNVRVNAVALGSSRNIRQRLDNGQANQQLPNLSGALFITDAQRYYLNGTLIPLDTYLNDPTWGFTDDELTDINPNILAMNRVATEPFDNQLLSFPIGISANVMSVNLEMLEELGFDAPPTTLDDLRSIACAASETTKANGEQIKGFPIRLSAQDMYSFIVSQGGTIFDEESLTISFTDEVTIEVLTFFKLYIMMVVLIFQKVRFPIPVILPSA